MSSGEATHFGMLTLCLAVVYVLGVVLIVATSEEISTEHETLEVVVCLSVAAGSLVAMTRTKSVHSYYAWLLVVGTATFGVIILATENGLLPHVVALSFVIYLGLIEPYRRSLFFVVGFSLLTAAVHWPGGSRDAAGLAVQLGDAARLFLPVLSVGVLSCLLIKHRELNVELSASKEQLSKTIVDMARANSAYQDYALMTQERTMNEERQRIARDIHDTVGYALTNNIMLMETALDLMKENALGLPKIIETARTNAEDGLEQVRTALYQLRAREQPQPNLVKMLSRMVRTFEQATGIHIYCNFRNMPEAISEEIDSFIYHLVQESLVNSFRHGEASEVDVNFWYDSVSIQVVVRDDGKGATHVKEGIGLSGMRQRIHKLGGKLKVGSDPTGFVVKANVPMTDSSGDSRTDGSPTLPNKQENRNGNNPVK